MCQKYQQDNSIVDATDPVSNAYVCISMELCHVLCDVLCLGLEEGDFVRQLERFRIFQDGLNQIERP